MAYPMFPLVSAPASYMPVPVDLVQRLASFTLAHPGEPGGLTADEIRHLNLPCGSYGYESEAVDAWLDDLKSSLPKAEHAVDRLPDPTPDDCTGLAKAAKQARTLVDAGSDDYDKLTSAQQTLTKSISACTANMTVDQIDRLFPQDGPSVTIPDTGKEAQ